MKVLTPLTGSSGLDVSSANVDTINLGSSGSENSDANVDNLTVWANADFKNNITLGSSTADTVILNAPIYGSGTLSIGSIDASGSSDVAVKIGTKRPLSSLGATFKALQVVTSLGSGSEQEILSVRPDNSGLISNAGVLEFAQPPTNKAAINITPGNGFAGVISWGGWNGGSSFGVVNGQTLYGLTANRNIKFETVSDAFFPTNQPNQSFIVTQGDSSGIYNRPTQFLFKGSPWIYTTGIKSIFKLGTSATSSQITGSDRILSLRTGIDTVAESEKLYINMSGTIASTSGTLVLTSDAASASGDIGVKVGTTLTDGTISGQTKLFAISTGIGGTESEKLSVKNGGLANGFSIESAGTSGKILINNSVGTSIAWSSISSVNVDSLRASISAPEAKIYSNTASGSSDVAVKIGTSIADSSVNSNTKLLSVRTQLTSTESEYFYVTKTEVSGMKFVGDGSGLYNLSVSGSGGGDITAVYAGANLTGGGTTNDVTLALTSSITGGLTNISGLTTLSSSNISSNTLTASSAQFNEVTSSFSGSGAGLYNLTASGINNFTSDVRGQFTAGNNIEISSGQISAKPGGVNFTLQFNSGSTFSGSSTLTYDLSNNSLLGTNGQFSGYLIANQLTGNLSGTASNSDKLDGLDSNEFAQLSQSNNFLSNNTFTTVTASNVYVSGNITVMGTASISVLNTTTQNTLQIADKYIVLASGSTGHEDLDGAGILWGTGGVGPTLGALGEHANILFSNVNDRLEIFPSLYVSGAITSSSGISSSLGLFTSITASNASIQQITGNLFGTSSYSSLSANSDLLDGLDSTTFAKTGSSNTFTATNTFTNNISGTTADFVSITAGTFNGSLNGTASNADLLDGFDSTAFSRLSANNTFTGINTFNNNITGTNAFFTGDVRINGTASFTYLETLNQQSLNVGDKYIVILSGATDHASLDGSGIQWGSGAVGDPTQDNLGSNAHVRYDGIGDRIQIFPGLVVTGGVGVVFRDSLTVTGSTNLTSLTASTAQISGGLSVDGTYFITNKSDLPAAVGGIITLANNATYYFTTNVDLTGDRLVCGQNTTLIGNSSENCRLKSTGLTGSLPLITSQWSLPIRFMAIEADYALDLNASGNANQALDWIGLNFVNTKKVGTIKDYTNFIMTDSALLDSAGLTFDGSIGTIGFSQCLLNGTSSSFGSTIITLPSTLTVTRRFRAIYTSFLALAGETAISASTAATIPDEGYILDTINFSGGGTYLSGYDSTSNKALFINCVNISNTSTTGFLYDLNNATNTTLTANVWTKVAGTTTAGSLNSKFTHTDNRLTYTGAFTQNFVVTVCANAASVANNQTLSIGVAKNGTIIAESEMTVRTATAGQDYPASTQVTVQLAPNDFVEVFMRNTATSNARLTDFNMAVKKIPT